MALSLQPLRLNHTRSMQGTIHACVTHGQQRPCAWCCSHLGCEGKLGGARPLPDRVSRPFFF